MCQDPEITLSTPFKFSIFGTQAAEVLPDPVIREVGNVFRKIGGIGDMSRSRLTSLVKRLGSDDCIDVDGRSFVVEYDEVLHFSTFRKATLESPIYSEIKVGFDRSAYLAVCGTFPMPEGSGRAHNRSAHEQFRCPTSPGECRHRQRAFYDFLKDVILGSNLSGSPGLIRISDRTDFVSGRTPGELAQLRLEEGGRELRDLLRRRALAAIR